MTLCTSRDLHDYRYQRGILLLESAHCRRMGLFGCVRSLQTQMRNVRYAYQEDVEASAESHK